MVEDKEQTNCIKNPAAETAGRPLFECLFFSVIPASEARRESFRKDSGQAGMTENNFTARQQGILLYIADSYIRNDSQNYS
jgi:hypothetical protein